MEELQKQIEALTAAVAALTARVDGMEKAPEPEDAPMAEDEKPEGEQMSDARDATIASLQARLDAMDKEKCRASFGDRLTPAMSAGFDEAWAKGGERLVRTIYGALPPALPQLRGHGEAPVSQEADNQWSRLRAAAKANDGDYDSALRTVMAENIKKAGV